jgi:hypothetical protein
MTPTVTCITAHGAATTAPLSSMLSPDARDAVPAEANQWIKRLRLVRYGEAAMRERFTYRGDSLWWFTELYLHKMRRLERAVSTILALEAARDRHEPARMEISGAEPAARLAAEAFGRAHRLPVDVRGTIARERGRSWASYLIGLTARLSRARARTTPAAPAGASVVAFVHTAFWRAAAGGDGPQQESYIGPILDAVARRAGKEALVCVGVGPQQNFRARRWWHPLAPPGGAPPALTPVEQLAPRAALNGALDLWRRRHDLARAITAGDDVRAAGSFRGCDLWDVLRPELEAAALLQWPWSVRAMDEAGAAIDALAPSVVVTYAEAGGWGRALVLEARRRKVRSVGLQHGFIYRHWLNYLHEPDEMRPAGADAGFPVPDRTLVFDRYAVDHLTASGHFPPSSIRVTGSARLDDLARHFSELRMARTGIRRELGVGDEAPLAILAAKFIEVERELPALVAAAAALPGTRLVIKPHPAETPELYLPFIQTASNVSLAPAGADLSRLLAAADAVVTMNSTVAIDGLVLGLPALVIGLPNNLTPFVDAGAMLGARSGGDPRPALHALLYDASAREAQARAAAQFIARHGMRADGGAAERAAEEILRLVNS